MVSWKFIFVNFEWIIFQNHFNWIHVPYYWLDHRRFIETGNCRHSSWTIKWKSKSCFTCIPMARRYIYNISSFSCVNRDTIYIFRWICLKNRNNLWMFYVQLILWVCCMQVNTIFFSLSIPFNLFENCGNLQWLSRINCE